ncbi:hypothetical protein Q8F55_004299 [Vanrija albida]|uniref:RING-type domain-containing protein n=1 Tax=Vanrija albida TaxID=181172 RepID=A0ABR3Q6J7_9TREE
MAEGAESSSSTSSEGGGSARRRFTAAEKGKGRAAPPSPTPIEIASDSDDSPILADESVQFIKHQPASPVPVEDEVESVIGDDDAITAYNCPVCFSAPTAPALTPCGHVLCYSCLHATLVAAIGRNQNPYIMAQPPRGRGRGRARGRGARGGRGGRQPQPTEWDVDSLREAVTTQADAMLRDQIQANGTVGDTAELIFNVQREERGDAQIEHPLKGLWQVQGSWVIEGECPVCRDPIEGGLGPIGSGIGGVILLETKVRHAGDLV